jgi:hypothetical protein
VESRRSGSLEPSDADVRLGGRNALRNAAAVVTAVHGRRSSPEDADSEISPPVSRLSHDVPFWNSRNPSAPSKRGRTADRDGSVRSRVSRSHCEASVKPSKSVPIQRNVSETRSHASGVDEGLFTRGGSVSGAAPGGVDVSHRTTGGVSGVGDTSELMADFCAKLLERVSKSNQQSTMIQCQPDLEASGSVSQCVKPLVSEQNTVAEARPSKAPLSLGQFTGEDTPLEEFLSRLETCARYNNWSASDRMCQLRMSLSKEAAALVWQLPQSATEQELVGLLKVHFGCEAQSHRFRHELRSVRRQPGQSVQSLHCEVARLLALAYPNGHDSVVEADAVDCFINAFLQRL